MKFTHLGILNLKIKWAILCQTITTGCSDWKLSKVNGRRTETVHFWPYVGKANMSFRGGRFFIFWILTYNFQLFAYAFSKNIPNLKHVLALPTSGFKRTDSVLQQFSFVNFQSECNVAMATTYKGHKRPAFLAVCLQKPCFE